MVTPQDPPHDTLSIDAQVRARRLQLLERNTKDVIWEMDLDLHFTYASPAVLELFGYSQEEVVGTSIQRYCDMEAFGAMATAVAAELGRGPDSSGTIFETQTIHKSGRVVPVEIHGHVLWDERGMAVGFHGSTRDITERRRSQERLRQAAKVEALGQLAGGIAHDFNNIITIISNYTALARRGLDEGHPVQRRLDTIQRASERAALLTGQLLAFSRRQEIQPQAVDLVEVMASAELMLDSLIVESIDFRTEVERPLWPVRLDPGQAEQVLVNLVVNARDAMPGGGVLSVSIANITVSDTTPGVPEGLELGEYVRVEVSDTGQGIDQETLPQVFEPFFTTKQHGKGTGLGLATVHGIVTQAAGTISVRSEDGEGTTFTIYLPRCEPDGAPEAPEAPQTEATAGTETILVVEDQLEVRHIVDIVLSEAGYTVIAATDGFEALDRFEAANGSVALVLSDVVMPRMSGRELADTITASHPEVKVLFMSGYTDDALGQHGIIEGDTNFLAKPFTADDLLATIRRILDEPSG